MLTDHFGDTGRTFGDLVCYAEGVREYVFRRCDVDASSQARAGADRGA